MRQSKLPRLTYLTLLPVLLAAFSAQTASACLYYTPLNPSDYDLPAVVFEGKVVAVHPEIKLVPNRWKSSGDDEPNEIEQVVGLDITFDVQKVIRGDISLGEVRVGWNRRGTHAIYPATLSDFKREWGTLVRVGLTTPDLFGKYCKEKEIPYTPAISSGESQARHRRKETICSREASGFHAKDATTKTYVFSARCFDEPYMIPILSNADGHYSR